MSIGVWEKGRAMPKLPNDEFSPNTFQTRVCERLDALGINAFQAAERGGFKDRKFVYDITIGRKEGVRGNNLRALASALDCDPEYLIGESDDVKRFDPAEEKLTVWVRGKVAAGMWIDIAVEQDDLFQLVESPFPVDPRYPIASQFDLVVQGTSLDRFARDGQHLRCISTDGSGRDWKDGDLVVAVRYRGGLRERTAKRARRRDGRWLLVPESDDPRWETLQLHDDKHHDDMDHIEIEGIVLYVYAVP